MEKRIALVTGGCGDIGTAICHEFCRRGAIVIAADRLDKDKALIWQSQQKKLGLAALCIGGGEATAVVVELIP